MLRTVRAASLMALLAVNTNLGAQERRARIHREGSRWILANASVERVVETNRPLRTVAVVNKLTDPERRHSVQSRGFRLSLRNDKVQLTAADFQVGTPRIEETEDSARLIVPLTCEKHGVRVTVTYSLGHGDFYLRKRLEVEPGHHWLRWVDVELCRLGHLKLQRFDRDAMPFPTGPWKITAGRPLLAKRELFLGVEHPASVNTCDEQGWISLRQHPASKRKVATSPAVIGLCPDRPRERLLDYFEQYVDRNRAHPPRRSIQWVAYFDAAMDDDACREKIAVAQRVFRRRGAPLDVVLMDSGWTDPQSIMRISPKRPDRLGLMEKLVEQRLGAKLGLHVITSGVKPMVDKDWLAAQGYDMIYHDSKSRGAYCFADPRVLSEFRDNLVRYARRYEIASYKFDWGHFACGKAGHRGHPPGQRYGVEAGASNFIRVHQALREVKPDIFLFNTGWYSPWWLWTYDAVFAAGADYNFGLAGPPSFSTASLLCTWRDATIRGNIVRFSPFFPVNSLMTVDPVSYWWHAWDVRSESPLRPFTDYFVTACLRGTQMIEIYNNIAAWTEDHADAAVAVLKWVKANDDVILASTRYLGGDPLHGEPYGYAHFTKRNRGILVVRNPTIVPRRITIPLDERAGMWPSEDRYVVRTLYPFTKVSSDTVRYGSTCRPRLDSHEVRVLEIWPLDALPEPMPIACRHRVVRREPESTTFQLGASADQVHVFSPVPLAGATPVEGQPHRYIVPVPGGSDRCPDKGAERPFAAPRVQEKQYVVPVRVPQGAQARVAIVFAEPGVKAELTLSGKPVAADAPHRRLADATGRPRGTRARASTWSLFGMDVGPGDHHVRLKPAARPRHHAMAVIDWRRTRPAGQRLTVRHGPIRRHQEPRLPQNWAWESRRVMKFDFAD